MPVGPDHALAPVAEIQEGIARRGDVHFCAPKCRRLRAAGSKLQSAHLFFIQRQSEDLPPFQNDSAERHRRQESFGIRHFRPEIDAPRRLHQNVESRIFLTRWQADGCQAAATIQGANLLALQKNVAEVMDGGRFQGRCFAGGDLRAI